MALLCTPVTKSSDRMATWNVPMRVSTFHPNKYVLRPRFFWSAPSRFVHARGHGHWSGDRAPCYPAVSLGNRPGAYRPAAWVCAYAVRGLGSNGGANFHILGDPGADRWAGGKPLSLRGWYFPCTYKRPCCACKYHFVSVDGHGGNTLGNTIAWVNFDPRANQFKIVLY